MTNHLPLASTRPTLYSGLIFFLCFLALAFAHTASAQTRIVLVDSAGDGGFETGTDFAGNGWTVVNPVATTRSWYVGTGQNGYSGARAAFIGNNATTVGTSATARTVHFYRSVTFPPDATSIRLEFKYKQPIADFSTPEYYDYIAVYTSSSAPVSGSLPANGMLRFGPFPTTSISSFTPITVVLPDSLAGTTTNLIFTFKADAITPNGYGAVDDVSLTYVQADPLPLEALTAGATVRSSGVDVFWNLVSKDAKSFAVERSGDGRHFDILATIPAGTTLKYHFTDAEPLAGRSFYRVRATGLDQVPLYSPLVTVTVAESTRAVDVAVFPNPASQSCTVVFTGMSAASAAHLQLTNASGQVLRDITTRVARTDLSLVGLAAGTYFVKCTHEGVVKVLQFSKQD